MNTLNAIHLGALQSFNLVSTAAFLSLLLMIEGFLLTRTRRRASHLAKTPAGRNLPHFRISRIIQSAFSALLLALGGFWPCQMPKRKTNPNPRTNGAARVSRQCTTAKLTSWDWLTAGISLTKERISCTRKSAASSHTHDQRLTTARRR